MSERDELEAVDRMRAAAAELERQAEDRTREIAREEIADFCDDFLAVLDLGRGPAPDAATLESKLRSALGANRDGRRPPQ